MTLELMMRRTIANCCAVTAMLMGTAFAADAQDIPTRVTNRSGGYVVSPQTSVQVTRVSAGEWVRKKLRLMRDGKEIWSSPLMYGNFSTSGLSPEEVPKFVRFDVNGNGRPDYLYLAFGRLGGPYGDDYDGSRAWSDDESQRELSRPWNTVLCGWLSGLIVLDDEKTAYAFNYGPVPDPFMHRNPYVQGEAHYKAVARGVKVNNHLEVTEPIPPAIWASIRKLIEDRACDTPYSTSPREVLPQDQRIKRDAKPEPFGLDWKPYFEDGLAMYGRSKKLYAETKGDLPAGERQTKRALGMFDLHAFFEAFAYDEIDPENKSPEYTAMLNDFAFYQMAPEDAEQAAGFENRREKVSPGVVAMLAHVIRRDPKRTSAYLNLADALWRNGQDAQAASHYRRYAAMMQESSSKARLPLRVSQRTKVH